MSLLDKMRRFMVGRYGPDKFSKTLLITAMIIMFLAAFSKLHILYYPSLLLLGYVYFRMFSKNTSKRYRENQLYLYYEQKVIQYITGIKTRLKDKEHKIFRCPTCKQKIRVPRKKGRIAIRCPKCNNEFVKKT